MQWCSKYASESFTSILVSKIAFYFKKDLLGHFYTFIVWSSVFVGLFLSSISSPSSNVLVKVFFYFSDQFCYFTSLVCSFYTIIQLNYYIFVDLLSHLLYNRILLTSYNCLVHLTVYYPCSFFFSCESRGP